MLSTEQKITLLKKVSSFKSLLDDQFENLANMCVVEQFPVGEQIFSQGDPGGALYIVAHGKVALERDIRDKTDTISLRGIQSNEYLGVMSLFHEAPRSTNAIATETTIALRLDAKDFNAMINDNPILLRELNHILCQRLVEAYDKISELTQHGKPRELQKLYDKLDF
jgi:CRP-like cAMP-binding protein